jgi:hypothetical protein
MSRWFARLLVGRSPWRDVDEVDAGRAKMGRDAREDLAGAFGECGSLIGPASAWVAGAPGRSALV